MASSQDTPTSLHIDVRLQRLSGAETTIRLPKVSTVGALREAAGVWCNSGEAQVYVTLDEEVLKQDNLALASLAARLAKSAVVVVLRQKINTRWGRCGLCQLCRAHRPSSWLRCPRCGLWVGKGCDPLCWPSEDAEACIQCSE